MFDLSIASLNNFALAFVPALFGIICHEVAHGWVAYAQGDPTAKFLGRLTLNPIKHLDPMGTLVFALTALSNVGFVIGWAKPVPVDARRFKNPRQGMMLVSVAGPLANFLVALLCAFILRLAPVFLPESTADWVQLSAERGLVINCVLAWFNLMPIPPLDGSHILAGLLPARAASVYASIGRYGIIIAVALMASGLLWQVLRPFVSFSVEGIAAIAGLP